MVDHVKLMRRLQGATFGHPGFILWKARGVRDVDQDNQKTLKTPSKQLSIHKSMTKTDGAG